MKLSESINITGYTISRSLEPCRVHKGGYLFIAIAFMLLFAGCGSRIQSSETMVKDGLLYQSGKDKPFSGIVAGKGYPDNLAERCSFEKVYKKGLLHGTSKYWYDNGNLAAVEPYKKGLLHGPLVHYYRSGVRKMMIDFVDGMRGGRRGEIFWTPDGKIKPG